MNTTKILKAAGKDVLVKVLEDIMELVYYDEVSGEFNTVPNEGTKDFAKALELVAKPQSFQVNILRQTLHSTTVLGWDEEHATRRAAALPEDEIVAGGLDLPAEHLVKEVYLCEQEK